MKEEDVLIGGVMIIFVAFTIAFVLQEVFAENMTDWQSVENLPTVEDYDPDVEITRMQDKIIELEEENQTLQKRIIYLESLVNNLIDYIRELLA